jgi:hypothetical protein
MWGKKETQQAELIPLTVLRLDDYTGIGCGQADARPKVCLHGPGGVGVINVALKWLIINDVCRLMIHMRL